ncbi:MAG TPA: phosphoenolpyruvate--protein phosphotransferase [Desulfotomaculum sp.]|nr:phosphoenolpyruvate--protein phosphotransferase [Desulfotomaculum sp.]
MLLRGVAASPGIEIGKVFVFKEQQMVLHEDPIGPGDIEKEIERFEGVVKVARQQVERIKAKAEEMLGRDKADIFQAHLMILDDVLFLNEVKEKIRNQTITAEYALSQVVEKYVNMFRDMEDDYLKERAADIKDIGDRLIKNLMGMNIQSLGDLEEEVVVVAKDLSPSDTAQMNRKMVKAFVTDVGGKTSHTAIMARSLEIPAVVGLIDISSRAVDGDTIIVDGNEGLVFLNPDIPTLSRYKKLRDEYQCYVQELCELKNKSCVTKCRSRKVEISANIGTPKDCKGALDNGAEGVGLYRTEFLYMDKPNLPDEDEQFEAYRTVAQTFSPRPVTIRTLDIGGDKKLPYLEMPSESNPFLGWRAIRLCLARYDIFKTQLRAILRASNYGKLRIMYPMISCLEEVREANAVLNQVRRELDEEGIPYDRHLEVGIMVEIPSAAVCADLLAKEVDFFSIGTNDLIQYTLAVDRMNERVSHLYEPFHPAVLRLIKNVIDASHRAGKWAGMCGEMAGDVTAAPILLGMGLDEFSMSPVFIPRVKKIIRSLTYQEARQIAREALQMESPEEIKKLVKSALS